MTSLNEIEILLVEDNPNDAELAIRSLKKQNLANNLVWLKDGAEALDFLFSQGNYAGRVDNKPKIILLDLRLPKVDGLEVLKKIKSDEKTKTIPVIVLTSSNQDRDIVESYKLGVNSYVSKPVEFDEFAKMVSQLGLYWLVVNKTPGV
ncbi:MAG: two-component system response regulator [Elusimicrobia bacterium RIFOXYA2_FULL_40_6]|nr:MAG: two-component system response regulator [Elusimicrobia bacterium RIFOXYA2_FULL_40_6]